MTARHNQRIQTDCHNPLACHGSVCTQEYIVVQRHFESLSRVRRECIGLGYDLNDSSVVDASIGAVQRDSTVMSRSCNSPTLGAQSTQARRFEGTSTIAQRSTSMDHDPICTPESAETAMIELSELNRRLMAQRNKPTTYQQQQKRLVAHSPEFGASDSEISISATQDFTESTLSVSHDFLGILQSLQAGIMARHKQRALTPPFEEKTDSSRDQGTGYNEADARARSSILDYSKTHSPERMIQTRDSRALSLDSIHQPNGDPITISFSALLSMLSCYTYILQAYESLFDDILQKLRKNSTDDTSAHRSLLIPGVSLGKFRLVGQHDLQIKAFLYLSSILLERIEGILGIGMAGNYPGGRKSGLLNNEQGRGLLEALYNQKEFDSIKADGTRTTRVKEIMYHINKILE